jgi:hypothetical protein
MAESERFYLLFELAKRWDLDVKKLVHLAGQGELEVRVLAPDQYDEKVGDKEYARQTIEGSYEYLVVDTYILQGLIGKGKDRIKAGGVIQYTPQMLIYTFRETEFCDLAVFESEVRRFERAWQNKSTSARNDDGGKNSEEHEFTVDEAARVVVIKGQRIELTRNQIACIRALKVRREDYRAGRVATLDMPQDEILRGARLPENNRRLDQVFRSRREAFRMLITSCGPGRYSLNLESSETSPADKT